MRIRRMKLTLSGSSSGEYWQNEQFFEELQLWRVNLQLALLTVETDVLNHYLG